MEASMGRSCCDICGDIGFATAIVTCSKCHKSREHIYCMEPNLEYVPKSWHCEACRCHNMDHYGQNKYFENMVQNSSGRQTKHAAEDVPLKIPDTSKTIASPPISSKVSKKFTAKKVETAKVKFLPVDEVRLLPSRSKPKRCSLQANSSSKVGFYGTNSHSIPKQMSVAANTEENHSCKAVGYPHPVVVGKIQTSTLKEQATKLSQPLHGLKSALHIPCKTSTSGSLNTVVVITNTNNRQIDDETYRSPRSLIGSLGFQEKCEFEKALPGCDKHAGKVDSLLCNDYVCSKQPAKAIAYNDDGISNSRTQFKFGFSKQPAKAIAYNDDRVSNSRTQFKFGEEDLPNPPAVNELWKGSFQILNYPLERYDGFQAHPPGKVSRKVYLFSKLLPQVLQLTLQSRSDVWPEIFRTNSPSEFDIALYFWADFSCRFRQKYNCLLELMDKKDLSLQSHFDGRKLLIFTSKHLPVKSQRMNKQSYLWGVFLSLKGGHLSVDLKRSHTANFPFHHNITGKESAGVTYQIDDMDIDMVGSKEVALLDKCLRSNSSCCGILDSSADEPMEKGSFASHSHQTKTGQYYEFNAPGYSRPTKDNFLARSLHRMRRDQCDAFDTLGFSRPIEETSFARPLHQIKKEQCDDFDTPGFSGCVTSNAADKGPIWKPLTARKVDAPLGFSRPIKREEWYSSFKGSHYSHTVSSKGELDRRREWTYKQSEECFCRICKVPCPGIISFMQHLTGKRHAASVQRIVSELISKEEEQN